MRRNPITVAGRIERCWLFTYSCPASAVEGLLPSPLELVARDGRAFWNVVVCELRQMRPWPLPGWMGLGYRHAAYRLYAQHRDTNGERVGGLHFVRSDCDSPLVAALGNAMTDYRFSRARIEITESPERVELEVATPDAPARALVNRGAPPRLESGSAFGSLEEAARFLKYEPAALSVDAAGHVSAVRIQRDEAAWRSRLVRVEEACWAFLGPYGVVPEACFELEPIDYRWRRAVRLR